MADTQIMHAIGRRKEAVCRVYLKPGSGKWDVNGRTLGDYFPRPSLVTAIQQPFTATDTLGRYDVKANVDGGGKTGQAGALRLAVARALVKIDEAHRRKLRDLGLLTRDARAVERKKPGRPKARKRFQFSQALGGSSCDRCTDPLTQSSISQGARVVARCRSAGRIETMTAADDSNQTEVRFTWQISSPRNTPTLEALLAAGVHFGHQTRRWNPKMRRFIFAERNGIHIIDLQKTLRQIELAQKLVRDVVLRGENVLFVCTKPQLAGIVQRRSRALPARCSSPSAGSAVCSPTSRR